jgi:protein TonB
VKPFEFAPAGGTPQPGLIPCRPLPVTAPEEAVPLLAPAEAPLVAPVAPVPLAPLAEPVPALAPEPEPLPLVEPVVVVLAPELPLVEPEFALVTPLLPEPPEPTFVPVVTIPVSPLEALPLVASPELLPELATVLVGVVPLQATATRRAAHGIAR